MKDTSLSGWQWLVEVSNHVGAIAVLLLILGISVFSAVKLPHWWYGAVILLACYAILFGEGAYRMWNTADLKTAATNTVAADLGAAELGTLWLHNDGKEDLLVFDVGFTNHNPTDPVSLVVDLLGIRGDVEPHRFKKRIEFRWPNALKVPIHHIEPKETVEGPVAFRILKEERVFITTKGEKIFVGGGVRLVAELTDRHSGQSIRVNVS